MADDRIGDHCWGLVNSLWVKGHLRQWISNTGDAPSAIFEDHDKGNVYELALDQLNFESDKPSN